MPRSPRNAKLTAESTYHVFARGNNKMPIFRNEMDYLAYLTLLDVMAREYEILIHHYVLMPNHVHILLTPKGDLPDFMKDVQGTYAKRYNHKYRHVGHVWSGRYKSLSIESDYYLFACGNYIEMNPVRAGLTRKPEEWPHSSYKVYAFGKYDRLISIDPFYSSIGRNEEARQLRYRESIDKTRMKR